MNINKAIWGNIIWILFHTLAEKLKDEHISELPVLLNHIILICNNLPCPDCQTHAMTFLKNINKNAVSASKNTLIEFLWTFHNNVNTRIKKPIFTKESLAKYKTANTAQIVKQFILIMKNVKNNNNSLMHGFHRTFYINKFSEYIYSNTHKYNT